MNLTEKIRSFFGEGRRNVIRYIGLAAIIVVAITVGYFLAGPAGTGEARPDSGGTNHEHNHEVSAWTCSMHPQVQLPEKGKCPICFMDLIPVETTTDSDTTPGQLRMTETAMKLANIQTTPVSRGAIEAPVRMVGKVAYDETRVSHITAWVPGRITRLYADFTGTTVRQGQPIVEIYSPELFSAQKELIYAAQLLGKIDSGERSSLKSTAQATLDSARKRLKLLGLNDQQIETIERNGEASETITINAPASGVVVKKDATEGAYVTIGSPIYMIADLSNVWVMLEAYETDIPMLAVGQGVEFRSPSLPGETFVGEVSFIDPVLNSATRTAGVRVAVANSGLALKPDMLVDAVVRSAAGSRESTHGGMHSSASGDNSEAPLMIPATAPLLTGKRAIAYVQLADRDEPVFEAREITLGVKSGDFYVVKSGLEEGERVVSNGAFKVDSELQIRAQRSMMNPDGTAPAPMHDHTDQGHSFANESPGMSGRDAAAALEPVYGAYFAIQKALASDDVEAAVAGYAHLAATVAQVDSNVFDGTSKDEWTSFLAAAEPAVQSGRRAADLKGARSNFQTLSNSLIELHGTFGHADDSEYFLAYCPMAFDNKGAYWLQTDKIINNSYFGSVMLRCGEIKDRFPAVKR